MTYAMPLMLIATIGLPIVFIVNMNQIVKTTNLRVVMLVSGLFFSAPWFVLWALAGLNRQHCPSVGPCKLEGTQQIAEGLFLLATPIAFVVGAIIAMIFALAKQK